MELKWVLCRKQALFLISCLTLLYLSSFDTVSKTFSGIRVSKLGRIFLLKLLNVLTDLKLVIYVLKWFQISSESTQNATDFKKRSHRGKTNCEISDFLIVPLLSLEHVSSKFTVIDSPCTVSCSPDWFIGPNQTKCYGYFRNSTSWEKSEMLCRSYGGHLASLASNKELSFVQKLCGGNASSCWIGGRNLNSSSTSGFHWSWSDPKTPQWNQSMFPKVPIRTRCGNGNASCRANICMAVTNGSSPIFGESCNASHAFICAVDSGNSLYLLYFHIC